MALSSFWKEAIQLVPVAVQAITANRKTSAENRQQSALQEQERLALQAFDPNSQIMKQQTAIEEGALRRDYARSIEEFVRAQRRLQGMGRSPLLDPERADEILSAYAGRGYVDAATKARQNAQASILALANQRGNIASSYGGMVQPQRERLDRRSSILTDLASGISEKAVNYLENRPSGTPSIRQAAPTQGEMINRQMNSVTTGGFNQANTPFLEYLQRSASRLNTGGRA